MNKTNLLSKQKTLLRRNDCKLVRGVCNYAVTFGYIGTSFKDYEDAEKHVYNALLTTTQITPMHGTKSRSSRTDKGVHALQNVISFKTPSSITSKDFVFNIINTKKDLFVTQIVQTTNGFDARMDCDTRTYRYLIPTSFLSHPKRWKTESESIINEINEIGQLFKGTHDFCNYTDTRKIHGYSDNDSTLLKRTILDIKCDGIVNIRSRSSETHFYMISITGKSFIYHQIRKMLGMLLGILKGHCQLELLSRSLSQPHTKAHIPVAPANFLYLDHCTFRNIHSNSNLIALYDHQKEVESIRTEVIHPAIAESSKNLMNEWEHSVAMPILRNNPIWK